MKARTKSLAIPKEVKEAVAKRDSCDGWPCCILCGRPAPTESPLSFSNAHYKPRSQGGLGIEENTLTLCPCCHREYDQTANRESLRPILRRHLQNHYPEWDESVLVYQKTENLYGLRRRKDRDAK